MNTKYMTNGALLVGPVVPPGSVVDGQTLGVLSGNTAQFLALAKRFRVRRHSDGWFVDGRGHKSQIWEYGVGKLGLTVTGPKFVGKAYRAGDWLKPKAIGDAEANFYCEWTDQNLGRLTELCGLQRRRPATPASRGTATRRCAP